MPGQRLLLVRLDHMGDIVMTLPAVLAALRQAVPEARIDVLTTVKGGVMLGAGSGASRVVSVDPPWSVPAGPAGLKGATTRLRRLYRFYAHAWGEVRGRYDRVIFLSYSPWERLISVFVRGDKAGFTGPYRSWRHRLSGFFLNTPVEFRTDRHVLDNCFDLLERALATELERTASRVRFNGRYQAIGDELLPGRPPSRPTVLIQAGSDRSMKSWSYHGFLSVARHLEDRRQASCVFIGTEEEIEGQLRYCERNRIPPPRHAVSRRIEDLIGMLMHADLFIANDGGPVHLASAMEVPTVAVFGPTDETVFGPVSDKTLVVREQGICGRRHYPWRPSGCCSKTDKECLRLMRDETVWRAAESMLARYAPAVR